MNSGSFKSGLGGCACCIYRATAGRIWLCTIRYRLAPTGDINLPTKMDPALVRRYRNILSGVPGVHVGNTLKLLNQVYSSGGFESALIPPHTFEFIFENFEDSSIKISLPLVLNDASVVPFFVGNSFGTKYFCRYIRPRASNQLPNAPIKPRMGPVISPDDWNNVECSRSLNLNV